jgi:hypothetical protein
MMIQDGDIVTLFSNAQASVFPNNTAFHFTNRLPHLWRIDRGERWRVGVAEIATLNTLKTIPKPLYFRLQSRSQDERWLDRQFVYTQKESINSTAMTKADVQQILEKMKLLQPDYRYSSSTVNELTNASSFNVLRGFLHVLQSQSGYKPCLGLHEASDGKLVLDVNGSDDNLMYILSPALQHALLLRDGCGRTETWTPSFDMLSKLTVHMKDKSGKNPFWYKVVSADGKRNVWPGFPSSIGKDPFAVLHSLAEKFDFFDATVTENSKSHPGTRIHLSFKATPSVAAVWIDENFLNVNITQEKWRIGLSVTNSTYTLKGGEADNVYSFSNHGGNIMKSDGTTRAFYMVDGTDLYLWAPSRKPFEEAKITNFKMTLLPNTRVKQQPVSYTHTYWVPTGEYTLDTFMNECKQLVSKQKVMTMEFSPGSIDSSKGVSSTKRLRTDDYRVAIKTRPGYEVHFEPTLAAILGLEQDVIHDDYSATRPVLLSNFTYTLMLYTNIIQPSIHGGQFETVLRSIPINPDNAQGMMTHEFQHIQYHDLAMSELHDIEVKIRDDTGSLVPFRDGRTMLRLKFIRVQ